MKSSRAIPWSIGIAIILIAMTACAYWLFFVAPLKTGGEAAKMLKGVFDGTITVNKTVFIKGANNMTELAVREKNITYTYDLTNSWLGSKKKIMMRGEFRGKAGYDFTDQITDPKNPWGIDVSEDGKVITARVPKPSILSVEMTNYKIIEDTNGLWNKISKDDREKAVNALQAGARTELAKTGILEEVDGAFIQQIKDALGYSAPVGLKIIRDPIP